MNAEPPAGAHLEHVLNRIGEGVLDEVDVRTNRRRRRNHVLVGGLVTLALVTGTAAAVVVSQQWTIRGDGTVYELSCLQDDSIGDHPFLGLRFTLEGSTSELVDIDPLRLCGEAWAAEIAGRSSDMVFTDDGDFEFESPATFDPDDVMRLDSVMFDTIDRSERGDIIPEMAVCTRKSGDSLFVIVAEPGESGVSTEQWIERCGRNGAFEYWATR